MIPVAFPLLLAFGGGIVSFVSPCVLPLVPVYLSVITGLDARAESAGGGQKPSLRTVRYSMLFVAGFSAVFVTLGSAATVVGRAAIVNHTALTRSAGALVVVMAVFLAGSQLVSLPRLYGERRVRVRPDRWGPLGAVAVGAAFGFGWTPCIGPILASVLGVASTEGHAARGAALLGAYSLGLGVPFLVGGLVLGRFAELTAGLRRHLRSVTLVSAALLAGLGALLITGELSLIDSAASGL